MAKTIFADGDIATKSPGTRILAAFLNKIFSHRHDGLDADGSAPLDYAVDTGIAAALVAALTPALTALVVGMPITLKVAAANTGPATLDLNGLGVKALHKLGGVVLAAGDLQAGQLIVVAYDGVAWQLLSYNSPPVTDAQTLQGQSAAILAPPGSKLECFMPTVPSGYLACDGRAVLRAQYPALYAAIGTTWGAGDNVTTFNLPEARGEFFRAWDNGRGVDADRVFGSWQDGQNKAHSHFVANADSGVLEAAALDGAASITKDSNHGTTFENDYTLAGSATVPTLGPTSPSGGNEARPRNLAVLVCIKY